jgi:hypothetical protein
MGRGALAYAEDEQLVIRFENEACSRQSIVDIAALEPATVAAIANFRGKPAPTQWQRGG